MMEPALRIAQLPAQKRLLLARRNPLSFAQERLWFLDRLHGGSAFYNGALTVGLDGDLRLPALAASLREILRRHQVLRTVFLEVDGLPLQVPAEAGSLPLPVVDLSGLALERRPEALAALTRAEVGRPFDLGQPPLLRALVTRESARRHTLLLTVHHIAADRWSLLVVVRELTALYRAAALGEPSPLPELPLQYVDFAAWQRRSCQGEALAAGLAYWQRQLAGAPTVLELPTDRPHPLVETFRGGRVQRLLPADVSRALSALSARSEATEFMVLLAAFGVLLHRYSGQEDILIGSSIDRRDRVELEGLIGVFVDTLVLRTGPSPALPFHRLLAQVRQAVLGAYQYRDVPFEKLVEALQPERALSRNPLFQVELNVVKMPAAILELPGLTATLRPVERDTAIYDLVLTVESRGETLAAILDYNSDLFDASTVLRLLAQLERLLGGIIEDDGQPAARLPLLTEAERHQLLAEWMPEPAPASRPWASLQRLFEAQVALRPDAVAARCRGHALTYRELNRWANRLAHWLLVNGIGLERRVAVLGNRGLALLGTLLGLAKAGAVYVPLDPGQPHIRQAAILADCGPALVITQSDRVGRALALAAGLPGRPRVLCWDEASAGLGVADLRDLAAQPDDDPPEGADPQSLANLFYTSGSTGRPKGAMVEHRGMLNHLGSKVELLGLDERSVVVQNASQSFDISIWQFLSAVLVGGQVLIYDDAVVSDAESLLARAERDGVTVLETVPTLLDLMLAGAPTSVSLPRLTALMSTGEALPVPLCRRWCERFPHVPLINAYGPTECSDDVAHHVFRTPPPADGLRAPVGRSIPGMGLFILDRGFELLPPGVPGQIAVHGIGVGRGYLGDAVKTALAFVPDPFAPWPGSRLYLTGDLGRFRPDGTLEYMGRIDHQIKLRGLRVELGEIEALLAQHPAVREVVVVLRHDGPGEGRLVAYTVGEPGTGPSPEELRSFLRERLPEHMVPSAFVGLDALPLTPNGKVNRRALPAPVAGEEVLETDFAAPRGPLEEIAAAIWGEVLGRERVRMHDNFFELGGHSLLAMRVVSRARSVFAVEVPLRVLFESPTPAGLAAAVERELKTTGGTEVPPLEPVSRAAPLPLSFAQQRLWLLAQLEPDSPAYNLPFAVHYRGLDLAAFGAALSEVVHRHEALRTAFVAPAGEPVQEIRLAAPIALPRVDLGGLPAELRLPESRRLTFAEALRPFDLTAGLLLRAVALIHDGTRGDVVVVTTLHHAAADAWSLEIFRNELAVLYEACRRGEPSPLPELPLQYGDFAVWQRRWLHGEVLEAEIAYWRERLAGLPPVLDLPADRPRPAVRSPRGGHRRVALPPTLAMGLRHLARRRGSTLFMVLLAAFQTLLARLSGRTDLAVGTPVAGRSRTEIEGLIGFFVNTLVLRTDLAGDPRFEDLLVRVRAAALDAYAHQDLPFERLVEELSPERSLAHTPLFQAMLALENVSRREAEEAAGSAMEELELEGGIAKFDLVFAFVERGEELQGGATYSADLFDEATVERWLGHFKTLLEGVIAAPELRLSDLPFLTAAELRQLAVWSLGESVEDCGLCLHELFAGQALRTPDAVAVVCGEAALSYRELAARAHHLAHYLRGLGVGPEVRVGICTERSLDMVVGMLGVLAAGGAYVPLDPAYPAERLAFTLADAATPVLLTATALLPILPPGSEGVERICLDRLREDLEREPAGPPETGVQPDNLAYVIYTSGSTGRPKGVAISHAAAVALVRWARTLHSQAELAGVLASTSICFDLSVFELFLPLCAGGAVFLARNALELASLPGAGRVTLINTVPSAIAELVRVNALPASVRTVNLAGEPLLRDLVDRIYRCPGVERVLNLYGPSEDTTYSTFTVVPREGSVAPTIGRPVGGGRARVLDRELQPLPVGAPGELFLGGRGLARGYLGHPERTAASFIPDPLAVEPGSRLYRTGDLARYRSDGELEFLGRIDHQVKVRGFRIELGEIEAALAGLPEVRDAVVLAREDEPGDRRLVAYVVPAGEGLDVSALRQALGRRLPGFMIPSAFLVLEALPLTPNGKVDRRALPPPEGAGAGRKDSRPGPLTAVEEVVAGIWEQILKVAPVGRLDNFFEIGGHSLLATRVLSRVLEAFAVEIPLRRLFEEPTPAGLAAAVESALRTRAGRRPVPPFGRLPRPGELPLSFAQQRLWFAEQLEPGSSAYTLAGAVRLRGKLDVAALRGSFVEIVRRHEVLRARFTDVEGRPVQSVVSELVPELPLLDLSSLPEAEREPVILRLTESEMQPFDLARGPLLRLRLLRLGREEHVLVLAMHHIVSDAWSLQVLLGELRTLYPALAAGRPCPLYELPVQYADFAAWQRDWMSGGVLQEHLGYWRRKLAGLQPLRLPTDHPRTETVPRGDRRRLYLSRELREGLRELGRREGATLFMTLLTGFGVVLHALSGQDDVAVGADIANRTRGETEGLIGFFINMLVLRTDLSRNPSFRALLGRVRETAFGAYAHQDLPYERLVEELQPERRSGHSPLFQVVFNFNNTQEVDQTGGLGSLGAVTLTPVEVEKVTVRFELALLMREVPEGLEALWLFDGGLFERETIERMHRRLEAAVADPEARLNRLTEAGEEERRRREAEARESGPRQKLRQVKAVPMKVEKI